jgi:phosphonate degradation associated HDIG domain protein
MKDLEKAVRINQVFELYERFGSADYIGEPVSQIEHMTQSAQLAEKEGYDSEVILAAFFHDIGHLLSQNTEMESMGGYGVKRHEQIGADFLREKGFPERIAKLVENHVQAKRYLTYKYSDYLAKLSEASLKTLEYQGGPMNGEQAKKFEKDPLFEVSLKMRSWDEAAKEVNIPVPDLNIYREMAKEVLGSELK